MNWLLLSPALAFVILVLGERGLPCVARRRRYDRGDWLLNLSGFAFQGLAIPTLGYLITTRLLPQIWPQAQGVLPFGYWGAFALNFVGVDLLYYWQHRLFHTVSWLWQLHRCHHASPTLDVWATSRNTAVTHFLFVYMLVNPVLGFLCASPEGFFAAAALTASLDLFRHSRLDLELTRIAPFIEPLSRIFVMPLAHHQHHDAQGRPVNFGANLIVWDRLFGTARLGGGYPAVYQCEAPPALVQLVYPLPIRK